MSRAAFALRALFGALLLLLGGCTRLLGDFSYDPNASSTGGSGSSSGGSGGGSQVNQGDIVVMPTSGLVTTEQGGKATFTIVLARAPTASVAIALSSSNTAEGTVSPSVLSFTPDNYAAPQMVQVTGVDDDQPDGPQKYTILTSPATSEDKTFHGIDPIDPEVTNIDDDTAGFTLTPPSGLVTTESGGEATFTLQLNHAPSADVTIALSSDNPAEGTVSPAQLVFTSLNWMAPQQVTVTGVDDDLKDGPQTYHVVTGSAMSEDTNYNGLEVPDEEVVNQDNDTAGVVLTPQTGLLTFENGTMTSFTLALASPPSGNVVLGLSSSDTSEGVVSPESLTFTPLNWMAPQVVSVTGVDDDRVDGNQPYLVVVSVLSSDDTDYAVLEPPNAEVTNIDDDSPGLTLTPTEGLVTGEDLSMATFTVVLNSKPSGRVLLDVSSSRPEEGVPTPAGLVFTEMNWNAPQTVTVMGVDDKVADGSQTYVVHVKPNEQTEDPDYLTLLEQDVSLTNTDDDSAGVTVDPQKGLTTTEAGGSATFSIKLNSQPTADVAISLRSSNTAEGNVSPSKLTFTPDNYGSPQTVTVRGVDDSMQDGNQPYRIITGNAESSDAGYAGMDVPNVDVSNVDDDSAGISVKHSGSTLFTSEGGLSATFTVVLNSQPASGTDVSFSVTSSDTTEGVASPGSLKFTTANWNAPQTVTVKGQNDDMHDGPQAYHVSFGTIASKDPNYAGDRLKPLDVSLVNIDNDSAGISLRNVQNLITTEKNAGTATFQVVLDSEPNSDVKLGLSSSKLSEGTVSPASLTFNALNWAAPQTVTVTGVDDNVADGPQQYFVLFAPAVSKDADYNGRVPSTANVTVTNLDDDSAGIHVVAPTGIATSEPNGTATFTLQLNSQPTADVVIPLASSKVSEGTVSPASLTFTPVNWNAPRTVTLTGVDDPSQDGDQPYVISIGPASSKDAKYDGMSAADLQVVNRDDDTAAIVVGAISGDTTEKNAGTATFTIVLQTKPTADVSMTLASSDTTEGKVSPSSVTFTPVNWASPQKITVSGVDDKIQDGTQPYLIEIAAATSADPNYDGMDPPDVAVNNKDDDTAGITVSAISGKTSESGGSATFTVVLDTQPAANVTLTLQSSNAAEGTISDSSLTFTADDWSSPRTITVTGVEDDGAADGDQPYTINFDAAQSKDPNYAGKQPAAVSVVNLDNDSAGIVVSATSGTTSEDGGTMSFTVVLTSKPKADVKIPISSSDTGEGTVSTSLLTFTTTNWAAKQTVTVTGVNDDAVDGSAVYSVLIGAPTSTDQAYADIDPPDVTLTNTDNDSAGIVVSAASGHTSEAGGTATFSIKLTSKPAADVNIAVSSSDPSEGSLTVTSVVLTASDWNMPHTVTVHGEDDSIADGPQPYTITTSAASSMDPNYDGLAVDDVDFINDDDDTAGYKVTAPSGHTSESGGTATFTVVLSSEPSADVSIPVSSSNTNEGTVGITSLDFTTDNWNVAQTVTVTGVNDDVADGAIEYQIVLGKPNTADTQYAAKDPPDVTLTNDDNDSAALNIMLPSSNMTGEAADAPSVTFTVVLTSKPKGTVTLPLSSSNEAEGVISSPALQSLTFDAGDWSVAQSITVQGVDDSVVDGDVNYTIEVGPPQTSDPSYAALGAQYVNLVNVDDDMATMMATPQQPAP